VKRKADDTRSDTRSTTCYHWLIPRPWNAWCVRRGQNQHNTTQRNRWLHRVNGALQKNGLTRTSTIEDLLQLVDRSKALFRRAEPKVKSRGSNVCHSHKYNHYLGFGIQQAGKRHANRVWNMPPTAFGTRLLCMQQARPSRMNTKQHKNVTKPRSTKPSAQELRAVKGATRWTTSTSEWLHVRVLNRGTGPRSEHPQALRQECPYDTPAWKPVNDMAGEPGRLHHCGEAWGK